MKKGYIWGILLVVMIVLAIILRLGGASGKTAEYISLGKEIIEERRNDPKNQYKEMYTKYGDILVNWYYEHRESDHSLPLYEVIYSDGTVKFESKEAIAEMVCNR